MSSIQDDTDRLADVYRKYIRLASFIIFPLMMGLAALAKPVIVLLLTEKWVGAVVLLQILCFDWMFDHLSVINLNLLYVKGRSDLALRLEVVKKVIATVILFSSVPFGLVGMCWGRVLYSLIATVSEYVLYKVFDWFESGKTGQRYCSVLVAGFCHGRGCGGGIFPL